MDFNINTYGRFSISIYDILGREVAVLTNAIQNAGQHQVKFLASGLSSGIYFYKLQANNEVITKKMMLLK